MITETCSEEHHRIFQDITREAFDGRASITETTSSSFGQEFLMSEGMLRTIDSPGVVRLMPRDGWLFISVRDVYGNGLTRTIPTHAWTENIAHTLVAHALSLAGRGDRLMDYTVDPTNRNRPLRHNLS